MELQGDFSIEMGPDDPVLELPWASADGKLRYVDLCAEPARLSEIEEACKLGELAEFLRCLNAPEGKFETVKCDAWASTEIEPAEEIFGCSHKRGAYCDFVFRDGAKRTSFAVHELLVSELTALLSQDPVDAALAEFVVRRCIFHKEQHDGFAITIFVLGFGMDEAQARSKWGIGLKAVEAALRRAR